MRRVLHTLSILLLLSPALSAADTVALKPTAYTSVPPLKTVLESIAGERWDIKALIAPGEDPHTFTLKPSQVSELSGARLYFSSGMDIENSVMRRLGTGGPIIIPAPAGDTPPADNGVGRSFDDPHIWLDPAALSIFAQTAIAALSAEDPDSAAEYEANGQAFLDRLRSTQSEVLTILQPYHNESFYVQHGAFDRFAKAFSLVQVPLQLGETDPSAQRITNFARQAEMDRAAVIYMQPEQNPVHVQSIAASVGARLEMLDPMPEDPLDGMVAIAQKLADGFTARPEQQTAQLPE